ncbi:MAG: Ig-like domain repeat protein, partial [Candidatus Acidiferrales bacterium]
MGPSQPPAYSAKILWFHGVSRETLLPSFAAVLFALLACSLAHAQGGVPLVTVATDQSVSSSLSNQFGVPSGQAVDQAGDLVFIGDGRSGLFFRPAGAGSATRLLQTGDPVPGFPGSHVVFFNTSVSINSFGKIYFEAVFSLPDGEIHQALMIYDGTNYHTIVSSESLAPPIATAPNLGGPNVTFSTTFTPLNQGINDNGDVAFTADPDATGLQTLYIVPSGKVPLAVATFNEPSLPPFSGTFSTNPAVLSGINALGQVLFTSSVSGIGSGLFVASEENGGEVFKVALIGDTYCGGGATVSSLSSTSASAALNNLGGYAFTEQAVVSSVTQSALCVGVAGAAPTKAVGSGTAAPSPIVSGTLGVSAVGAALAIDDSGDVAFVSPITGSVTTTSALLRYTKAGGQLGVVAYNTEAAPGLSGQLLSSSFAPFSIGNNATVAFEAGTGGSSCAPADNCGTHTVYQQSGSAAPIVVATDGQGSTLSGAGTLYCPGCLIVRQLNSGSVFFDSLLQGGTAYYGQFIGTPGSIQAMMNTADTLPAGSRVSLLGILARASGTWVGFTAQESGGRLSLFVSNTATSVMTKAVSEGDSAPGTGGVIATANNSFVNSNGGIAINTRVSGTLVGGRSAGTAFFTWSPGSGLAKAVALGDATPISGTVFESVTFNSAVPAPFNSTGQLVFEAAYEGATGGTGVFLFSPASGGTIAKIAATGDAAPGGGTFTNFSTSNGFNYGLNQSAQVAFGASRSVGGPGFFVGAVGVSPEVVAASGTSTSAGPITGVVQFSGFNDSGVLSFLAVTSTGTVGLFTGVGAPATPTPSVLAYSGEGVTGGGSLLVSGAALNNDENDAAFLSSLIGGSANTALFLDPGTGPNAGTLQPVIYQGQSAPGGGSFTTLYAPSYALGPDGELITTASYVNGLYNPVDLGVFLVRQNGSVARVLGAGDTVPGGGTASQVRVGQGLAAGAAGEFAFWASINGGSAQQAIFATAVPAGTTSGAVTLGTSANPVVAGGLVTLTATVATAPVGTPTGSVTFYDNGVSLGTRTLTSGQAQFSTGSLLIGAHPITAQYSGDTNYAPGNSNVLDETITGPGTNATATTLTSTPDPSAIGQTVTFTATVTSGAGTPFGTVSFFSGTPLSGVLLGSATLNGSGQTTLNTSFSPSGASSSYSITAQYDGASTFAASTSTALLQSVIAPDDVIAPVISSISPNAVPAAGGAFTLTINGTGFVSGSVVQWNGAARTTTFVSQTQLTASLSSSDIAVAGWDQVTVSNAGVGGLVSNAVAFQVASGIGPTIGTALNFVPVTPCRLVDTRPSDGYEPFSGLAITGGTSRNYTIPQSPTCNIPSTAAAYSLNVAVIPSGSLGFLTLWPAGQPQPGVATVSSIDGRVRSNAAIVPAGTGGAVSVFASNTTDLVMDINGYFTTAPTALQFYPVTPCRVVDTRNATGSFGGPSITGNTSRTFPLPTGACNLPGTAQAYSLNLAVVPQGPLGFVTAWPTGQTQPGTANLSSTTGTVTASAAIVPAGTNGSINVFASNTTDLIIDVNGYFAPAGTGGLSLYNLTPCRVLDTRQLSDTQTTTPFSGELDESIQASACGVPVGAQAYVLNATVVPPAPLGFLTLWP